MARRDVVIAVLMGALLLMLGIAIGIKLVNNGLRIGRIALTPEQSDLLHPQPQEPTGLQPPRELIACTTIENLTPDDDFPNWGHFPKPITEISTECWEDRPATRRMLRFPSMTHSDRTADTIYTTWTTCCLTYTTP